MHMTNTRITDPEILERYYPVSLRQFTLRNGSGGAGKWRGGHGVVREVEFLRSLEVGVLTERRALAPRGIQGGCDGLRGVNLWIKADGATVNLGGKASVQMAQGDRCAAGTACLSNVGSSLRRTADLILCWLEREEADPGNVALQDTATDSWWRWLRGTGEW